jgi:hypothetical protein
MDNSKATENYMFNELASKIAKTNVNLLLITHMNKLMSYNKNIDQLFGCYVPTTAVMWRRVRHVWAILMMKQQVTTTPSIHHICPSKQ